VVYLNEWMAANTATVVDPADQDFDDWFELHNPNDFLVDLSGYSLTDNLADPRQWVLPVGTTIPPQGFLLVWADNEPGQNALGLGLHASFRLNQDGEALGLFAPDGTAVDSIAFGDQASNVSEGRYPDSAPAPFAAMTTPTPGGSNVVPGPEAPQAIGVTLTAQGLLLRWKVQPGRVYQLEFTEDLGTSEWLPFGAPTTAPLAVLESTDPLTAGPPHRFYRLVLLR
jgi:hypothetical protein